MNPGRARPTIAVRFVPRAPSWTGPFLRRVAQGIAALPEGHAVLVERVGTESPTLLPSGPVAAAAIGRAASGLPGSLVRLLRARDAEPRRDRRAFGVLLAPAAPRRETRTPAEPEREPLGPTWDWLPDEPEPPARIGLAATAVQWHWFSTGGGPLAVRIRLRASAVRARARPALAPIAGAVVARLGLRPSSVGLSVVADSRRRRRAWARGSLSTLAGGAPFLLPPAAAARAVGGTAPPVPFDDALLARHVAVLGASGAGKSAFLAALALRRIAAGRATVVLDVHGDLGPAIAQGLSPAARARVVAVDACAPSRSIRGIALFSGRSPAQRERESAHLVAGLRHLSHDGSELYWGSRLEQVFDVFVRLVEEERGGLSDLYELLTEPARREAARLTTRRAVIATFLDELMALLRRHPDYLQPAVARVQKVVLQPKLAALLDARARPIDPAVELGAGRALLFRIPAAELGPSGSRFAATLLASRIYLALASAGAAGERLRVLTVLDEAQSIAPSLLAEVLAEGRKFGFGAVVATQYAGRLAPEALAAAEGAAGTHLLFHVPRSGAAAAGRWAGLDRETAERLLPALPAGVGLLDVPLGRGPRRLITVPRPPPGDASAWRALTGAPPAGMPLEEEAEPEGGATIDEALLLALAGVPERPVGGATVEQVVAAAGVVGPPGPDALTEHLGALLRRGWADRDGDGGLRITVAGARRLGVGAPSGATREGAEHRRLLVQAFWIFARRGARLEFVRQGRFDTRLPDGLVRQLPGGIFAGPPESLRRLVEARSRTWLWRAFGGRDVHVEAEVSGAERPERIRRGLAKARARTAAVVFLVGDARRAARVRAVLARAGARLPEARVWTLPASGPARQREEPSGPEGSAAGGQACGRSWRSTSPSPPPSRAGSPGPRPPPTT
jgi:hypothetical protein